MYKHIECHIVFAAIIVFVISDFFLETHVVLDLSFASGASLTGRDTFSDPTIARISPVLEIFRFLHLAGLALLLVLVTLAVAAFEKGAAFNIAPVSFRVVVATT